MVALVVKNPPANAGDVRDVVFQSLGWEDPLENRATHSSILAWRIPWTEEPGGRRSVVLPRVGYDWNKLARTRATAGHVNSGEEIIFFDYVYNFGSFGSQVYKYNYKISEKSYLWGDCFSYYRIICMQILFGKMKMSLWGKKRRGNHCWYFLVPCPNYSMYIFWNNWSPAINAIVYWIVLITVIAQQKKLAVVFQGFLGGFVSVNASRAGVQHDEKGLLSLHLSLQQCIQKDLYVNVDAHVKLLGLLTGHWETQFPFEKREQCYLGFPGGSVSKQSICSARDPGSVSESGRSPGGRNGNPPQYSCLEKPMVRGAWRATVHGVAQRWRRLMG